MKEQQNRRATERVGGRSDGSAEAAAAKRRSGMLTFAAVVMFVVAAAFEALMAISAFVGSAYVLGATGAVSGASLFGPAIVDAILAFAAFCAGLDILRGGDFGLVMGYPFAGVGVRVALLNPGLVGACGGDHRALGGGHLRPGQARRLLQVEGKPRR